MTSLAERFATLALANVAREYPNQRGHVLHGAQDLQPTRIFWRRC